MVTKATTRKRTPRKKTTAKRQPRKRAVRAIPAMAIAKGIGHYLEECRGGNGRRKGGVSLGALPGFPMWSDDPSIIEGAIEKIEAGIGEGLTPIKELQTRTRLHTLRQELLRLNRNGGDGSARDFFVEHAAGYAEKQGIPYVVFREMGVPAPVLAEAGVTRNGR